MEDEKLIESLLINLRSVVQSSKDGIPVNRLQNDYKSLVGTNIPLQNLGYNSLETFLEEIPDVIKLKRDSNGQLFAVAVPSSSTIHLAHLISKQKKSKANPSKRIFKNSVVKSQSNTTEKDKKIKELTLKLNNEKKQNDTLTSEINRLNSIIRKGHNSSIAEEEKVKQLNSEIKKIKCAFPPKNECQAGKVEKGKDQLSTITIPPSNEANPLAFLRMQPIFQQMREVIQQNPQLLSAVLQQIGQNNPLLLLLICQNQEAFVHLLNESSADSSSQSSNTTPSPSGAGSARAASLGGAGNLAFHPVGQAAMQISSQDMEAIEKQMHQVFKQNPHLLNAIIQQIEKNNPQLLQLICQNQAAYVQQLIKSSAPGSGKSSNATPSPSDGGANAAASLGGVDNFAFNSSVGQTDMQVSPLGREAIEQEINILKSKLKEEERKNNILSSQKEYFYTFYKTRWKAEQDIVIKIKEIIAELKEKVLNKHVVNSSDGSQINEIKTHISKTISTLTAFLDSWSKISVDQLKNTDYSSSKQACENAHRQQCNQIQELISQLKKQDSTIQSVRDKLNLKFQTYNVRLKNVGKKIETTFHNLTKQLYDQQSLNIDDIVEQIVARLQFQSASPSSTGFQQNNTLQSCISKESIHTNTSPPTQVKAAKRRRKKKTKPIESITEAVSMSASISSWRS